MISEKPTFEEYQREINRRWPSPMEGWIYPLLGLAGEVGETVEEFKKSLRYGESLDPERLQRIKSELGDVLHYLARVASEVGLLLEEIAWDNLVKTKEFVDNPRGA